MQRQRSLPGEDRGDGECACRVGPPPPEGLVQHERGERDG